MFKIIEEQDDNPNQAVIDWVIRRVEQLLPHLVGDEKKRAQRNLAWHKTWKQLGGA